MCGNCSALAAGKRGKQHICQNKLIFVAVMPCDHKFQHHLDLKEIDFEPVTLMVGTFNPSWPASNTAGWFYGRTVNTYFWDVLPRLYGEASLANATPAEWKQFCRNKRIALTDLISTVDDADEHNKQHNAILGGFSDRALVYNFDDYTFVDIVQLLRDHPSIQHVYLTRGIGETLWRHLWNPVAVHCNRNNIHERKLLTPSDDAAYHHEAHNSDHPEEAIARLQDYIFMRWQREWHS